MAAANDTQNPSVGIVLIGRNEGDRLVAALAALPAAHPVVYVDSASTDQSVANAEASGATVVHLDMSIPFSAARARNEGFETLLESAPDTEFVMFLDGDTVLAPGWLEAGTCAMADDPTMAVVAGRLRERYPDASWYNRLCDIEWDGPVGEVAELGGNAMYRVSAFSEIGGFVPEVIAGEEPELCLRLRGAGWSVHRLSDDMGMHDADIHEFGVWWKRATRSGYAAALGALMHGGEGFRVRETARALLWGAGLPLVALLALLVGWWPVMLVVAGLYGLKFWRLRRSFTGTMDLPGKYAGFLMLTNVAEVFGIGRCLIETISGKRRIVEYK